MLFFSAEKIGPSCISRVLRLILVAPNLVEVIPDGRHPAAMTLAVRIPPSGFAIRHVLDRSHRAGNLILEQERQPRP
jgi:hypothetical protein